MSESILPERLQAKQKKAKRKKPSKQLGLIIFTLLAIGLIVAAAYYFFLPKQEQYSLDFYTYAQVGTKDFLETIPAQGSVIPKHVLALETKIAAVVEEILVQEGQDVVVGDPLIRLYSEEAIAEKNTAETEVGEAKTKLAQLSVDQELEIANERVKVLDAQEQLAEAEQNLQLQEILYGYGSIARVELERAEQGVETAKRKLAQNEREFELLSRKHEAERASLDRTLAIAQEKLEKAVDKIANFIITAPFTGRILSLKIPNNRVVTAHQELGEIADLTWQIVELQVSPGQTDRFELGNPVSITLGQNEYAGEVSYIAPQAKQSTDGPTVLVRVDFLEEVSHLRPNSAVSANIHLQLHEDSLYLPRGAYLTSGQQLFVYVLKGQTAQRRDVQFGLLEGTTIQILRGLELGEKVIISSYDAFRHLEEVTVLPEGGHAL